eukprot:4728966-Ditylum_brightwellii.AAC.1
MAPTQKRQKQGSTAPPAACRTALTQWWVFTTLDVNYHAILFNLLAVVFLPSIYAYLQAYQKQKK